MKMTTSHQVTVASIALMAALTGGCESTKQASLPPPTFASQEIAFPKEMNYARELRVTDKNDPKQIVNFALSRLPRCCRWATSRPGRTARLRSRRGRCASCIPPVPPLHRRPQPGKNNPT